LGAAVIETRVKTFVSPGAENVKDAAESARPLKPPPAKLYVKLIPFLALRVIVVGFQEIALNNPPAKESTLSTGVAAQTGSPFGNVSP
jgi:hypothetical protein